MSDAFESSRLGTKQHWDSVYKREIATFQEIGDEGEAWFGEDVAQDMVDFVLGHGVTAEERPLILDVGCGNGHLLYALVEADFAPETMTGADYSQEAIDLCRKIAEKRGIQGIEFTKLDCLRPEGRFLDRFDLVFDKGTYDAISLAPTSENSQSETEALLYARAISSMMKQGALFCITSCNFTIEELKLAMCDNSRLVYYKHLPKPTFTFGGAQGSTTSTVLFRKP